MEQTLTTDQTAPSSPTPALSSELSDAESTELVTRYVVVEVNHNQYGMGTASTVELMSAQMTQITRVPHSPAYIAGVINHRGTIIPVIDLRSLLGFAPRSADAEKLSDQFNQLKEDHVNWLNSLQDAVYLDTKFTKATDPTKCNFGKWYSEIHAGTSPMNSLIDGDPILKSLIERFDIPHQKIHGIAEKVLHLKENGKSDEAIALITQARETDLKTMCELFDLVLEAISAKLESMLVITEIGTRKAAIAVDGVSFVFDCKDDSIQPLPDTAENSEFLTGLVHQPDGSYILIADLKLIYSTACPGE